MPWGKRRFNAVLPVIQLPTREKPVPASGGVVGRPAGSVEAFRYSAAMKSSGLVWDEATLDRFLAAPRNVVAKTTMTVSVTKPEDRQNIIAYLKSLSQ